MTKRCRWCHVALPAGTVSFCSGRCRERDRLQRGIDGARSGRGSYPPRSIAEWWNASCAEIGAGAVERIAILHAYDCDAADAAAAHLPGWCYPATAAELAQALGRELAQALSAAERAEVLA